MRTCYKKLPTPSHSSVYYWTFWGHAWDFLPLRGISAQLVEAEQIEYEWRTRGQTGDTQGAEDFRERVEEVEEDFPAAESVCALFSGGTAPAGVMGYGVICFVIALCCFVKETQPHVVWVLFISLAGLATLALCLDYMTLSIILQLRVCRSFLSGEYTS
jgi:hypothetical protein